MKALSRLRSKGRQEHIRDEQRWKNNLSLFDIDVVVGGDVRRNAARHVL